MFWEIYKNLCAQKGESPNAIAKKLNISSGSVTWWKKGKIPHNATLKRIADYFGVSVEYLKGETEKSEAADTNSLAGGTKQIIPHTETDIELLNERILQKLSHTNDVETAWEGHELLTNVLEQYTSKRIIELVKAYLHSVPLVQETVDRLLGINSEQPKEEKVYKVKIAARNGGGIREDTLTEEEYQRLKNLPDADDF